MPEESRPRTPETREQLIRLLQLAAELEHQLLCAYLFTSYTVKQDDSEGGFAAADADPSSPGAKQRQFMFQQFAGNFGAGPRIVLIDVAVQEMLHLTLVSNLLSAITCQPKEDVPFFSRVNFPLTPQYLRDRFGYNKPCVNAWIGHWPFDLDAIRGWEWFEDFEEGPFTGPQYVGSETCDEADPDDEHFIDPEMEVSTLVELYQSIARGFVALGELEVLPDGKRLFCGNREQQVETESTSPRGEVPNFLELPRAGRSELTGWPPEWDLLREINTTFEAIDAIHTIVVQGEGDTLDVWAKFIRTLGYNPDALPSADRLRQSISHHKRFMEVRVALEELVTEDPAFRPGRLVHVFERKGATPAQKLGFELSELFDDLYSTFMAMLSATFRHPIPDGSRSSTEALITARYERITLAQTSLAAMLYTLSPFGNALPQIASGHTKADGESLGIGPCFNFRVCSFDWDSLIVQFDHLSRRALGLVDRLPDQQVWLQPNYLEAIEPDKHWPRMPLKDFVRNFVGLNLQFIASRLRHVRGNRPIVNSQGDLHSCMGLNECRGLDINGAAAQAGEGSCATAIPHTCATLNACNQQSMCGFDDQDVPGVNIGANSGGCNSPALPSARNTNGNNTPSGIPEIFERAQGNVWRHARILFEKRMKEQGIPFGPSRGPAGVGGDDFPGSGG